MLEILVLFYSRYGAVLAMAEQVALGINSVPDMKARIRTVPPVSTGLEPRVEKVPENGPPYVSHQDMQECVGLALGSPTRFGNMAAPLKYFLDSTASLWFSGALSGKPAMVFTSTSSMHGGQESTLLSMMLPLIHQGMIIVGTPFTEERLVNTKTGGTPYGPSHTAGAKSDLPLSEDEMHLCRNTGKRLAEISKKLFYTA